MSALPVSEWQDGRCCARYASTSRLNVASTSPSRSPLSTTRFPGAGALPGICRGMIVHDAPSLAQLSEDHGRHARQLLAAGELQAPSAPRHGRLRSQGEDVQHREVEGAHLLPRSLIAAAVAVERRLPAARLLAVREEDEVGRVPIARHVSVQVAAIPGLDLGVEDGTNAALDI